MDDLGDFYSSTANEALGKRRAQVQDLVKAANERANNMRLPTRIDLVASTWDKVMLLEMGIRWG